MRYHPGVADAWRQRSMDELVLLPEAEAVRLHFDSRNGRVLFRLLAVFAAWAIVEAMIQLAEGQQVQVPRSLASLVLIRWLYFVRQRPVLTRYFRPILLGYLSLQLVLLRLLDLTPDAGLQIPQDFLLPAFLLFFRLPATLAAIPLAALWAASAGRSLLATAWTGELPSPWPILGQSLVYIVVLASVARWTRRLRPRFLDTWRREHRRYRESSRMREELDDARKIQLSMLPRKDPQIPWLDVAGISIPASEVGGDYFDYFTHDPSRPVIVIADVAGHGVASALLLSGIRSCLYLLQETPMSPADVLTRLDRMVRLTTDSRLFVTMLYALFDDQRQELTYSVAGHPPLLLYRADRHQVEEIGHEALPLGTALGNALSERTVPVGRGDIVLFSTDGIAETLNGREDLYGNERLEHRLRSTAHDRSAREILDTLLGDVWSFKGDGEQTDDITMVVVKVR